MARSFAPSDKGDHTKQIIKQAINVLNNLPPQKIQNAVILVCKDDDEHMSLKSLIGSQFPKLKQAPFGIKLNCDAILIDPGEYIAYPDKEQNFIIRRYLAKYVKKVKFIFPISLSQISQLSLMSIQQLFVNFFHLFQDLDDLQMGKLAESCCIMALDIKNQQERLLYKERLLRPNGLLQQGFIKNFRRNIEVLLNTITTKDLIYGGKIEGNILEQFQSFLQKLDFFDYNQKIRQSLPKQYRRSCEQRLQISSIWHSLMTFFNESVPLIIQNKEIIHKKFQQLNLITYEDNVTSNSRQNAKVSYKINAKQLLFLVPKKDNDIHSYSFLGNYQPKKIIYPIPIPAIIYSKLIILRINLQIDGVQACDKMLGYSKLMEYFYFLYRIECISIDIYVFLSSYFHIYDFLSSKTNDDKNDLITKISLLQIRNSKDCSIIRNCIKLLLNQLENTQLSPQDQIEIALDIQKIIEFCNEFKEKLAITSKILSNLKDHLANIYYKKLKSQRNKRKYTVKAISYFKYIINCKERHESQILDIIKGFIQMLLTNQHSYKLGYQIASLLPQYEVQNIFLTFYEDKIGLCPQKFKFIEQSNKTAVIKMYYSDYANYLLKIGYHQKLRELCIKGLQTTRNIQEQQIFRIFLIKAQKQTEHQQFISNSIQKHKQIILSNDIIDKIQKEFLYLKII